MTRIIKPQPETAPDIYETGNRIVVLVEGKDDVTVFKKLFFDRLSEIAFRAVGGDKNLEGEIELLRGEKLPGKVFGIRDRDFRSDEEVKASLDEPDSILFTLGRYCIENYLLEPRAVLQVLDDVLNESCPWSSVEETDAFLLQLCSELCLMMAANWVLREAGLYARSFTLGDQASEKEVIVERTARHLGKLRPETRIAIEEKESSILERLHSIDTAYTRINGKHLLHRLHLGAMEIGLGVQKTSFFNLLLAQIKQQNLIHADLREIVEQKILAGS
ncbi:hypothetical protein CCAX7_20330 [Capsulimonas corticalis]|uniref:DUF4435 domain-containing protein n=1 Tax=Capsulimonas corticalis TaxID=2219043 RepID=A0A402D2J5_9BACT|nr:DUF4435 domain-containing protein [Capsulimonas corticalis]BDI29982.1 hypothetical protein CCAX7_20330 [Capsulimonas corticalis]